jgi:eukaryotic-like serine/threonine-protein kinase
MIRLDAPLRDEECAQARDRFLREAQTARQLNHPGIVRVLDAGATDGVAWIAMEVVAGADLTRYTRPLRLLPEPLVARIGARVARALAHAHTRGVVHRDVKPGNILVDLPDAAVKLTDFGVARQLDHSHTRSGVVLGSPEYMAPELLGGAEAGPAADLYGLGVTLYELLAGRRPHQAGTMGALLRAVAAEAAPDLRALRPELPPSICEAVMLCLAKRPEARPQDAAVLAEQLEEAWDKVAVHSGS